MSESKIVVTNSAIIINNYDMGDCLQIENCFKVFDPRTHSYYYIGMHYDSEAKRLYLPRGIDIWYVEKLLGERAEIMVNTYDKYHVYEDAMIKYLPRDETQKEALRFMIGKDNYYKNQYKSQLSVNLATGKGKTYISIASLMYTGIRGIVITSTVGWINQWKDKTLKYTDTNPRDIYIISGSPNVARLLRMEDRQLKRYKLFLVTHGTLRSYGDNHGWNKIGELFKKLQIGIKIFDEAHLDFNNICMIDFYTNTYRTYYLTATPSKSDERENKIYQMSFKNVPSISLFNPEEDPHTSYIAIFFNSRPTVSQISDCKSKYGINLSKYTNYVVYQEEFYKLLTVIIDLCWKLAPMENDKVLIYIGTNDAIKQVKKLIDATFPEISNLMGIYTSIIPNDEKEKTLKKKFILSTTKSAGAALDIEGLKMTIDLAEPYKSEVIAKQSLGRTRNKDTYYIDIIDVAFEQCRKFYYKKLPIFEKYATDCSVVKLNKNELNTRYDTIMNARMIAQQSIITPKRLFSRVKVNKPKLFTKV